LKRKKALINAHRPSIYGSRRGGEPDQRRGAAKKKNAPKGKTVTPQKGQGKGKTLKR